MGIDAKELKVHCMGQFGDVMKHIAPVLTEVIDNGRNGSPCPNCGGEDRASLFGDFEETGGIHCRQCELGYDIFAVLQVIFNCSFTEALGMVEETVLGPRTRRSYPEPAKRKKTKVTKKSHAEELVRLEKIWRCTEPPNERVMRYLKFRGLSIYPPPTLRYHHSLPYSDWDSKKKKVIYGGNFPAIVSQYTVGGGAVGLHIIYLSNDDDGKAPVKNPKKTLKCVANLSGSIMELYPLNFSKRLWICEGVETALAIYEKYENPVWATGTGSILMGVVLPEGVNDVVIAVDNDKSGAGEKNSQYLAERLMALNITVGLLKIYGSIPKGQKSVDVLDVLNTEKDSNE